MMHFLLQAIILHSDVRSTHGKYTYRGEYGVVYTIVKSLCRAPETNITLYVDCTSIHKLKLKLPLAMRLVIERWVVLYALSLPQPHIYSGLLRHVTVPHIRAPPPYCVTSVMGRRFILLKNHLGVLAYLLRPTPQLRQLLNTAGGQDTPCCYHSLWIRVQCPILLVSEETSLSQRLSLWLQSAQLVNN